MKEHHRFSPLLILYRAFDAIELYIAWFLLLAGIVAIPLTFLDVLPPAGGDLRQDVLAAIAWLLVTKEGYNDLKEIVEDEVEG